MIPRVLSRAARSIGMLAVLLAASAAPSDAAPVLRGAEVRIALASPTSCEVRLSLTIDGGPTTVEHRLERLDGASVSVTAVDGAERIGELQDVGRTLALTLRPTAATYRIDYRVDQPEAGAFRCPIWLPTTPADGRSRAVRLIATLPSGASASGTMPSFAWAETEARLARHAAATCRRSSRLPFAGGGTTAPWNVARLMDAATVSVLVLASLLWLRRSAGRSNRGSAAPRSQAGAR